MLRNIKRFKKTKQNHNLEVLKPGGPHWLRWTDDDICKERLKIPPCCTARQTTCQFLLSPLSSSSSVPCLTVKFPVLKHSQFALTSLATSVLFYSISPCTSLSPANPFLHSATLPDGVLFCRYNPLMPSNRAGNILKGFGQGWFGSFKYCSGICMRFRDPDSELIAGAFS